MKLKCLDGTEIALDIISSAFVLRVEADCRSKLQFRCGQKLKEIFPRHTILEEFIIPRSGGLALDFFIPQIRLAFEVQGAQHYRYNNFHYKDKRHFARAQANDKRKAVWCEINKINLIYFESEQDVYPRVRDFYKQA